MEDIILLILLPTSEAKSQIRYVYQLFGTISPSSILSPKNYGGETLHR